MKIVMIGAGNLATQLTQSLVQHGHEVVQVYSRTRVSADALVQLLVAQGASPRATDNLARLDTDADVYLLSVKDSALADVIAQLPVCRADALFLHTAGSMPMTLFTGRVSRYGVFYPMQTFSKHRLVDFSNIPLFVEGVDETATVQAEALAQSLSHSVYRATSEQRKYLHLSAVFTCNFTNHCYALAYKLLQEQGLPFETMLPLIDETARKVHTLSPLEAQTGPAVRYDENVMQRQLQLLQAHPDWQQLYRLLSTSIHEQAQKNHD